MPQEAFSSQLKWLYSSDTLTHCRTRANHEARTVLSTTPPTHDISTTVRSFASGFAPNATSPTTSPDDTPTHTSSERGSHPLLTPEEELLLIQFYAGKLPNLIGPNAPISRLRRDVKVSATAHLLFRRFFLSNSVMLHDPKAIMVAAAFLGSKVEDATVDIRYLEEGTKLMQAPVTISEIISTELNLLSGINFELMCFHPYKTVLAYTEDLRTYLKSEKGRKLAVLSTEDGVRHPISGEDLRPIHDGARRLVDDVCVSDIPLLYSPGQIGLAAMMVANEELEQSTTRKTAVPLIDFYGYIQSRFENHKEQEYTKLMNQLTKLCGMLKDLKKGMYGCGNHGIDMEKLKGVHKKLKKCRAWGNEEKEKKKKKKKRKKEGSEEGEREGKVAKVEEV